jgi:hypothetical protein
MDARHVFRPFAGSAEISARYRASHRRFQRLRWRDTWTREMWWLLAALLIVGILIGTGVIRHPPHSAASDRPR